MSTPLRSSSLSLLVLLVVSYIIPFTTALPGNLWPRQDAKIPEILGFVPACAKKCVSARIAPINCPGDQVESCLCGDDPQSFKDTIWQCIDEDCGPDSHHAAEASVEGLCETSVSTTSTTGSPTGTQSATKISSQLSSESPQTPSVTAEAFMTSTTVSKTAAVPVSTGAGSGEADAGQEKKRPKLSTPAIIGISIGSFGLLAAVVGFFVYCAIARRKIFYEKQAQSMTPEPHSRDGEVVDNKANQGALGTGIWMSINSASTSTLADSYYSTNQPAPPINANVANERLNAHRSSNISPMSPVSPIIPQGFEFGEAVQQRGKVVESRRIIENPHLFMLPAVTYTPASPIGAVGRVSSPAPPVLAPYKTRSTSDSSIHSYDGDLPGMAISTDLPVTSSTFSDTSTNRHTCSTVATMGRLDHPSDPLIPLSPPPEYVPSPVSESSESTKSSLQSSHSPLAVGISRSDTLAWRRGLEEAAGRAVTRVLHSEQSVNEEMDAAKRRKSSIPGLDRFSRRLSRDNRADEESLYSGERSPGFWGSFGSKSSRRSRGSPPRSLMSKRSNSGGSKYSRSERV